MSHVVEHVRCPECAKRGRDTSHDNLVIYSDGGQHCFSCGYHVFGDKVGHFKAKQIPIVEEKVHDVLLPADVETTLPRKAKEWLEQYELTNAEILTNHVMWSPSWNRLIFPYFVKGNLLAWQGRYFGDIDGKPKWYSVGQLDEILYTIGEDRGRCVLVEDIVSAIKVSRTVCSVPLFGSHIPPKMWARLTRFFECATIFLDPDKRKEAAQFAEEGRLFLPVDVILADADPKEIPHNELMEILNGKTP